MLGPLLLIASAAALVVFFVLAVRELHAPRPRPASYILGPGYVLMPISSDVQAQLDRLANLSSEIDTYTANQVAAAVAAQAQDHADEVQALTAQIDALNAKLGA